MNKYYCHASGVGKIMANPRTKSEFLSKTAKTAVEEQFLYNEFGIKKDVNFGGAFIGVGFVPPDIGYPVNLFLDLFGHQFFHLFGREPRGYGNDQTFPDRDIRVQKSRHGMVGIEAQKHDQDQCHSHDNRSCYSKSSYKHVEITLFCAQPIPFLPDPRFSSLPGL